MATTRERQIKFIESFGNRTLLSLVTEMLCIDGHWFLTDEQIATLATKLVRDERRRQHHDMRERAKAKARRLMAYVDAGVPGLMPELKAIGGITRQAAE